MISHDWGMARAIIEIFYGQCVTEREENKIGRIVQADRSICVEQKHERKDCVLSEHLALIAYRFWQVAAYRIWCTFPLSNRNLYHHPGWIIINYRVITNCILPHVLHHSAYIFGTSILCSRSFII